MVLYPVRSCRHLAFDPLGLAWCCKEAVCQLNRLCWSAFGFCLGGSVGGISKPASLRASGGLNPVASLCGFGWGGVLGFGGYAKPRENGNRVRLLSLLGSPLLVLPPWLFGLFRSCGLTASRRNILCCWLRLHNPVFRPNMAVKGTRRTQALLRVGGFSGFFSFALVCQPARPLLLR